MVEGVFNYTPDAPDLFEPIIEETDFRLNHVIIKPGKMYPPHRSDAHVTIIITRGRLSLTLADQKTAIYQKGQVLQIPKGVVSTLGNTSDETTEVFVIKR